MLTAGELIEQLREVPEHHPVWIEGVGYVRGVDRHAGALIPETDPSYYED